MAQIPPDPDTERDDNQADSQVGSTGTPRWVIVLGILLIAIVLGFVILQLAGIGGDHGPGRHASADPLILIAAFAQM